MMFRGQKALLRARRPPLTIGNTGIQQWRTADKAPLAAHEGFRDFFPLREHEGYRELPIVRHPPAMTNYGGRRSTLAGIPARGVSSTAQALTGISSQSATISARGIEPGAPDVPILARAQFYPDK